MRDTAKDTSCESFIQFWEYVSNRGLMKVNTARSLAASARQVLSVEKKWGGLDIRTLDVEGMIDRFKNLRARDYKPETLNVYGRRLRRARTLYLEYLADPAGWRPISQRGGSRDSEKGAETGRTRSGAALEQDHIDPSTKLITYPFPLRDECVVQLRLPGDLSEKDVGRLTSFLKALVMNSEET